MTTDYLDRFKAQLAAIEQAVAQMPAETSTQVPGLGKDDIIAFCHSFLALLEKVDTGKALDRTLLAYGSSNVPEHVIQTWTTAAGVAANGVDYFLQNYGGTLVDLRNRLEAATGTVAIQGFSTSALKRRLTAIENLFTEATLKIENVDRQREDLDTEIERLQGTTQEFATEKDALASLAEEIATLKERAEMLVNGDGGEDLSIAELQKSIAASSTKASEKLKLIVELQTTSTKTAAQMIQSKQETDKLQAEARKALEEAGKALRGSTQAGLAESFIYERDSKMNGLMLFAAALAIALIGASVFAVREVLPALSEFTKAIATNENNIGALSISLTIRTVLLAPFVFLAWFAATQYRKIDLLRIDYAAKVAVAKAYIGYKDEVKGDPKLLAALKHFLIQRFGEHPVRLVSKSADEDIPLQVFGLEQNVSTPAAPTPRRTRPTGQAS